MVGVSGAAQTVDHRPTRTGGAIAVAAAVVAVGLVADAPAQLLALGVAAVGLAGVAFGVAVRRRGGSVLGATVALAGAVAVLGAIGLGVALPSGRVERFEIVPGLLGVVLLTLGLVPVAEGRERRFVTAGAGALVVAVLTSGVLRGAPRVALLAALAATVVAWDAGERAVGLGEHVGRGTSTSSVELAGSAGSAVVGAVAVTVAVVVHSVGATGVPLAGLALLLAAAITLTVALWS